MSSSTSKPKGKNKVTSTETSITNRELINNLQIGLAQIGNAAISDFQTNYAIAKNQAIITDVGTAFNKSLKVLQAKGCILDDSGNPKLTEENRLVFKTKEDEKTYLEDYDKLLDQEIVGIKLYKLKISVLKDAETSPGKKITGNTLFLCQSVIDDDMDILAE